MLSTGTIPCTASLAGVLSWVFLHFQKIRGDIALALETLIFVAIYLVNHAAGHSNPLRRALGFLVIHALTLVSVTVTYRLSPFHPLARFPGPLINKVTSLKLAHIVFSGRRHLIIQSLHQKYGKFVRIAPNNVSINSRAAVAPIYSSSIAMDKSDAYSIRQLPGDGLFFMLPRVAHGHRRDMWAKGFTNSALELYQPILERRTMDLVECMKRRTNENGVVNLSRCIEHWSYDVMGDIVFGEESGLELMRDGDPSGYVKGGEQATIAFDCLGEVPWLFEILWYLPVTGAIRSLQDLASQLLKQRKLVASADGDDIASHLLGVSGSTGRNLTFDELTMDAIFAIQAGSDTSANVLQYTFFFIISHPEVFKKLQDELDQAFPNHEMPLDFAVMANLPYLNAVVYESLRLGTPLSGLPRITPSEGAMLDGEFIPGNTVVSVPAYTQQLDPSNFWPRTREFVPERWLPGGLGADSRTEPSAIMSFSFGPFGCLGRTLAIQELRIVVARLSLCFDIYSPDGFDAKEYHSRIRNIRTTLFPEPLGVIARQRLG
ncbi:cytochrome P450 [Leucogyrophana mollusca]|uniref:Cytochrome P450 n=1 Tax=Leucogyrophana mollusca TaxID=85980 RepID=A0ACB8BKB1_9AGAM|nr:cytochrome P450 [Leucogyrophana mollusca]